MKNLFDLIDSSYTAGLIAFLVIAGIFGLIILVLWLVGRRNVKYAHDTVDNFEPKSIGDIEIMRKVKYKDYNNEDIDQNFMNGLN